MPAPTRNNRGKSHGNGAAEGPHGHLKQMTVEAATYWPHATTVARSWLAAGVAMLAPGCGPAPSGPPADYEPLPIPPTAPLGWGTP